MIENTVCVREDREASGCVGSNYAMMWGLASFVEFGVMELAR